ncbi:nickel pincer cofactor biosynthesis protein LarB [Gloeobacter kilaueensis]|uniref:NCAIR mutase (PurE)-related protein n=1 Tax=Gloeobacter kilaueensis (strain ATCC BAA-2537 / CCAP 1431/1 / ULC 316 / JS1) TaxID=1183438 RepID=U5QMM4_GLOK1|nr:nickel pincer cofactor biosynthesis protein LarB [Gloeobacter kilaueensis]AGY58824.1 NCAIR mutase (PurE)-related protein [Gloeobacter kilaueensis JS1]
MKSDPLQELLQDVAAGRLSVAEATAKLRYETLAFARLDHARTRRTGLPEVVWGPGKTAEQIALILERLQPHNPVSVATRVEAPLFDQVAARLPGIRYYPQARLCALFNPALGERHLPGCVGVVSAGTADGPVAEEAALIVELLGSARVVRLWDVGVAGIHRLLDNLELLGQADVLIVVAGMEGALASVVGGLVEVPVIAVPTSVGYGAHFGGLAPLLAMLNSCAAGIGVVNIDNGFGAAMLAIQILRSAGRLQAATGTPPSQSDPAG